MWCKRFFEERQAWCASWMIARHAAQGGPALASTLSALPQAVFSHVDAELDGLSAILREAIVLRYLRGFNEQAAAAAAGCPLGTMKRRASEGLAKLRARLSKRGVALGGVALVSLLTSEASAAVPETLLPSILATVKTAAATGAAATGAATTATMLAEGAMKMMFYAKAKMVAAAGAVVAALGLTVIAATTPHPLGLAGFQAPGYIQAVAVDSVIGRHPGRVPRSAQ